MKRVIAIAFSDLHLNLWSKFNKDNSRTLNGFDVLFRIAELCDKYKCPSLFCGDLFHKPENLDNELSILCAKKFKDLSIEYPNFKCYAINGNHDLNRVNTINHPQKGWINFWYEFIPWLKCIDFESIKFKHFSVTGIPYIDHNQGLSEVVKKNLKSDILLLHTDYPGAEDTDGRVIDSAENLNINIFKPFKLVLIGHIHKPQRLGKKVYMVGAPQQQRRTDRDCKMGYLKIFNDFTCQMCYFDNYPRFIDVYSEEDIKEDGNYYTVIPKPTREIKQTEHKITKQLSKKKLARLYMKQKGDNNKSRCKLLTKVLIKSEQC